MFNTPEPVKKEVIAMVKKVGIDHNKLSDSGGRYFVVPVNNTNGHNYPIGHLGILKSTVNIKMSSAGDCFQNYRGGNTLNFVDCKFVESTGENIKFLSDFYPDLKVYLENIDFKKVKSVDLALIKPILILSIAYSNKPIDQIIKDICQIVV